MNAINLADKLSTFTKHLLLIEPTGTPNTGDATTAAARRVI